MPLSPVSSTVDAGLAATLRSRFLSVAICARLADDAIERVGLRLRGAQHADLAPQSRGLERLRHRARDIVEVERLVGEVVSADLHRFDRGLDRRVRRQENHEDVGIVLLDPPQHRDAVHVGQLVVEQDEVHALYTCSSAVAPFSASSTSYPSPRRRSASDHRMSCSSSTTRIVAFRMVCFSV